MPKLLLYVYSSNPDYNANCDVAIVDLSPALARVGLTRMDRVRVLMAEEVDLCTMHALPRLQHHVLFGPRRAR
jgi:hypothetical protein